MKHLHTLIIVLFACLNAFAQDAAETAMLKDLNPSAFNTSFSDYNQNTSIYLTQLSELAYSKPEYITNFKDKMRKRYPQDNIDHTFIVDENGSNDTQVLIWGNSRFITIAFRGTEPKIMWDLLTDGKFWNYENFPSQNDRLANMPPGHGGFRKSLSRLITMKNLFQEIEGVMKKCNPALDVHRYPIYLTGHSLGAALSQLFIEPVHYKGYNWAGAYHFAPPLAVSCDINNVMKAKYGSKTYDVVNYKDYVPRAGRFGVAHFGRFYRICDDGLIYKESEIYMKFNFGEYHTELSLHSLGNHLTAIRRKNNSTTEINKRSVGMYPCMEFKGSVNNCAPPAETSKKTTKTKTS